MWDIWEIVAKPLWANFEKKRKIKNINININKSEKILNYENK